MCEIFPTFHNFLGIIDLKIGIMMIAMLSIVSKYEYILFNVPTQATLCLKAGAKSGAILQKMYIPTIGICVPYE